MLIVFVSLASIVLSLDIPIITDYSCPKSKVKVKINNNPILLETTLSQKSYINVDLDVTKITKNASNTLNNDTTNKLSKTNITCPSVYCSIVEQSQPVQDDGVQIGKSFPGKINIQILQSQLSSFPINALYFKQQTIQTTDGRLNLFTLAQELKSKSITESYNFTLFFNEYQQYASFGKQYKLKQILKVEASLPEYNKISIKGFEFGSQSFNVTQFSLDLGVRGLSIPKNTSTAIIDCMKKEEIECWFDKQKMSCDFSYNYPQLQLRFNQTNFVIDQSSLIKSCYPSISRKRIVCDFQISLNQKDQLVGGRLFIQRYPVTFDSSKKLIIFSSPRTIPQKLSVFSFTMKNVLGFNITQLSLVLSFVCILLGLKCYHICFKRRSATAYAKYGNLVSTSTSSIQSQNSERDMDSFDIS